MGPSKGIVCLKAVSHPKPQCFHMLFLCYLMLCVGLTLEAFNAKRPPGVRLLRACCMLVWRRETGEFMSSRSRTSSTWCLGSLRFLKPCKPALEESDLGFQSFKMLPNNGTWSTNT